MKAVTLKNIADEVGVSVTTVHRALRNKAEVSSRTSKNVLKVASQLGYGEEMESDLRYGPVTVCSERNWPCQTPVFKTGTIGLLLVNQPLRFINHLINLDFIANLQEILSRFNLLLTVIQMSAGDECLPAVVSGNRLDGIIMVGDPVSSSIRMQLKKMNLVSVFFADGQPDFGIDRIMPDYQVCGTLAARYFAERGHQNVAYLDVSAANTVFVEVEEAFAAAAMHGGLKTDIYSHRVNPELQEESGLFLQAIDRIVCQICGLSDSERPTGLFIPNHFIAVEVWRGLKKYGMGSVNGIDIVFCGDKASHCPELLPISGIMDFNIPAMAERVVEKLFYRIRNPEAFAGVRVLVSPRLIAAADAAAS